MTAVIMFTGKGGVGKTTCSAATAAHYAARGPTLAISTDATPSLSHIYEKPEKQKPVKVLPNLFFQEISGEEIKAMWDARFGREVYEVFSAFVDIGYEDFVEFMTSVLPGLGEEFMVDFIRETALSGKYHTIVWDTAPLGQTLSLLATPALLGEHLRMAPRIYSKLKVGKKSQEPVLEILKRWEKLSAENMEFLQHNVDFALVTIPEALAVEQIEGVFKEFGKYSLSVKEIIVNNVVKVEDSFFLTTKARQQKPYLKHLHQKYAAYKIIELPLFPQEIKGLDRLKKIADVLFPR